MNRPYDPDRQHRRSLRLKGYDYTQAGAYFVTVVVQGRLPLFGIVVDGQMRLNAAGQMVQRIWNEMPNRFPSIAMDTFIAMPNHIHGIIMVGAPLVGAHLPNDATTTMPESTTEPAAAGTTAGGIRTTTAVENRAPTRGAPTRVGLGDVVGAFKSLTTLEYARGVRDMNWPPFHGRLWQRNFYEHIVRTDESMKKIRQYILDNPAQWAFDRENPTAVNPTQDAP